MSLEPVPKQSDAVPQVTVLMSVFNGARTLREAVESILDQTFSAYEFLIIDDASTDETPQMLDDYAARDARIRIVRNDRNLGLTQSLNRGIGLSRGALIARMDADDISRPNRLDRQVSFMAAAPEIAVSSCAAQLFGLNSEVWSPPETHDGIVAELSYHNCLCHAGAILRSAFLNEHGLRYPDVAFAQDYLFWAQCSERGRLAGLREILIDYRTHPDSVGAKNRAGQRQTVRLAQRLILASAFGISATDAELQFHEKLNRAPGDFFDGSRDHLLWALNIARNSTRDSLRAQLRRRLEEAVLSRARNIGRPFPRSMPEMKLLVELYGPVGAIGFAIRAYAVFAFGRLV